MASDINELLNEVAEASEALRRRSVAADQAIKSLEQQVRKTRDDLAKLKAEQAAEIAKLEAKQAEADKSAEEAGARIRVGNEQIATLQKLKSDADKRVKELTAIEASFSRRKTELESWEKRLQDKQHDLDLIEARLEQKLRRLKEAVG